MTRLPASAAIGLALFLFFIGAISLYSARGHAASSAGTNNPRVRAAFAGDDCATATVINPAALPFSEESTLVGATNNIDPGFDGCAPGLGSDVVYSFTPTATDTYIVGATPQASTFDLSLYIVTDCANPGATCVAGANNRGFGKGEFLKVTLNAGIHYFIVVDNAQATGEGAFHFSLRRGALTNDTCASPTVIAANRLPFNASATTYGAANDLNPGVPCLGSNQSGTGPDVVYQFTSPDSQNYDLTVTPKGNYDVTVYIVTNCNSLTGCTSSDIGGSGDAEFLRRNLAVGTTYFIVVDGFQGDAGDFTLSLVPTFPLTPVAPSNLVATAVSSTQINLSWTDNATDELGFHIERSLDGTNFSEIATVNPDVTSFNDTGLTPSTTYFYRIFSFNNFGNSAPSNIAGDTTQPSPIPQFPVINVSPASIDFGSVRATTTATQTVTVTNQGAVDLIISNISNPTGVFAIANKPATPITLATNQSVNLSVQFNPPTTGSFAGSFTISSNDPTTPFVTVNLTGIGTAAPVPNLEITPPAGLNFPSGSSVSTIELKNTGEADLAIVSIQRPALPFGVGGIPALPAVLHSGDRILLTVSFSPSSSAVFNDRLTIISNDPDTPFVVLFLSGTSTPQSELFKVRAPAIFNAVIGVSNTINVVAVNGTGTDLHLSASTVAGGTFTDRGNGRGDLVITPSGTPGSTLSVLFTASDSAGRTKSVPTTINLLAQADTANVRVSWTAPETAPGAPTGAVAIDQFITPLSVGGTVTAQGGFEPAAAAGLVGYAVYRGTSPGVTATLSNLVGVVPASATSFTDALPHTAGTSFASFQFYYVVTALYQTGTESSASNEATTLPNFINLEFKSKSLRFQAAGSNVAVGAILIVDNTERYTLTRSGDLIVVGKNATSTPGGLKPKKLFKGTHQLVIQNPNGQVSLPRTFSH